MIEQVNELSKIYALKLLMRNTDFCFEYHNCLEDEYEEKWSIIQKYISEAIYNDELIQFWEEETTSKLCGLVVMQMCHYILSQTCGNEYDSLFNHSAPLPSSLKNLMNHYTKCYWNVTLRWFNYDIIKYFDENTDYIAEVCFK
jgi:hypothetical protein